MDRVIKAAGDGWLFELAGESPEYHSPVCDMLEELGLLGRIPGGRGVRE